MASIPGPILLIVGSIVGAVSFKLNSSSLQFLGPYALFMYVGILFTFVGLIKTLIWLIMRKSAVEKRIESKKGVVEFNNHRNPQTSAYQNMQRIDYDKDRKAMTIRCPGCGNIAYSNSNFCSNCGMRLR